MDIITITVMSHETEGRSLHDEHWGSDSSLWQSDGLIVIVNWGDSDLHISVFLSDLFWKASTEALYTRSWYGTFLTSKRLSVVIIK